MKIIPKIALLLTLGIAACKNMTRDIDLDLPEVPRELVVECYLEIGKPYRVLVTETKGYFDDLSECPLVKNATVVIHHAGQSDTLNEAIALSSECSLDNFFGILPFFNADFSRFYNYGSNTLVVEDYDNDYTIEVIDHEGDRYATAKTRFLRPAMIDTVKAVFNDEGKAYATFIVPDDPNVANFYRIMLHDSTLLLQNDSIPFIKFCNNPDFDISIDDARFFDGGNVSWGTPFEYEDGDTLIFTVYHIDKTYHDYLETLSNNRSANGNPFAQPGQLLTNIQGGVGIFTFLAYDRDTLYVRQ